MFTLPLAVTAILARLEDAGFAAYAVGGAIRDLIRGVAPHDWDITTAALPEQVMEVFDGETIIPTGIKHGTVTLVIDHIPYEITTFRGDVGYSDHRRPDAVEFLDSIEADLARRDFTAGAIAYSPTRGFCDPFDGVADVKAGILRAVGDPMTRFEEDGLRILRALRFASACGFAIEGNTACAIHQGKRLIAPIAVERIYSELTRTLCGEGVGEVLLSYGDVIAVAIPELEPLFGCPQNSPFHNKDVWAHTAASVAAAPADPILRWTMLLHDIAKPDCRVRDGAGTDHFPAHPETGAPIAEAILDRLKAERATRETVTALVALHDIPLPTERGEMHRLLIRLGRERTEQLFAVKQADLAAKAPFAACHGRDRSLSPAMELANALLSQGVPLSVRELAVSGSDLIALGYRGKAIGEALESLLIAVTNGAPNEKAALLHRLSI